MQMENSLALLIERVEPGGWLVNWIRGTPRSILALEEDSEHKPETPDFFARDFSYVVNFKLFLHNFAIFCKF